MAMLSGTAFLSGVLRLLKTYDYTQHRFAPARVSPSETLFIGIACAAFARIYQLLVGSKSDPYSKTQTEMEVCHIGYIFSWSCLLFMVHKMNPPQRNVSTFVFVVIVLAAVSAIVVGFSMRKKFFKLAKEALRLDAHKATRFWRSANVCGFTCAMSPAAYGLLLKILGSSWLAPGVLFCLSLGFLLLWRPRQMAHVSLSGEVYELTSGELLKRMTKEQAVTLVQGRLRRMEGSLNDPNIPAAKIRLEKLLEELKLS